MSRRSAVAQLVELNWGIERLLNQDSPPMESLCYVLEQDTLPAG